MLNNLVKNKCREIESPKNLVNKNTVLTQKKQNTVDSRQLDSRNENYKCISK